MKKIIFICISLTVFTTSAQNEKINFPKVEEYPTEIPTKENTWVFIMTGQSNMTGRGFVEPQDTISNPRVLSINKDNKLILAKEPLAFYSSLIGLDCGLSFGKELLNHIDESIKVLILPTAVGGSSTNQWINDDEHRGIKLMSNFKEKIELAQKYGTLKGVLWHQGESDAHDELIPFYKENITVIFRKFRNISGSVNLPIYIAQLGSFFPEQEKWNKINEQIEQVSEQDENIYLIKTDDFVHKGDSLHFNSASQRLMGIRFAKTVSKTME
ncbi:sialate O-acetylesterase [Urechidicola croceus]|uniref:Sialate O-acetylesterase domain-containing protein n=1 Tax=Urechidicola croceus TaxID=1850246 RepID=A0A1D8P3P4_9FLAO|nr:sialate O-acetylesterase [Urechidicola croceus]AOW19208.1 hypothetical protein LPB138_00245 [Urechidicola croceus]